MKNGLIERNPVPLATLPKGKPKEQRRVFSREEQDIFMEYAKGSYLYNLFALAIRTGLRGGELRGFFEDAPETATSRRDIPLTKDMIDVLDRQKQLYGEKVLRMDGYIFHLPDGTPISRERLQNEIDRIVKRINADGMVFERFTPHCLRNTFATRAIESGMKPQTLKAGELAFFI